MISLLLVYKHIIRFIWIYALTHFGCLVDASFRRSAPFVLHFPARLLLGLEGDATSYPTMFTSAFWPGWNMHIWLFYFTRDIPIPLIFSCAGLSAVSDMDSLSRALLRPWASYR